MKLWRKKSEENNSNQTQNFDKSIESQFKEEDNSQTDEDETNNSQNKEEEEEIDELEEE